MPQPAFVARYMVGQLLPDIGVPWASPDGRLHNFSSGYTLSAKIGVTGDVALREKSSGLTAIADPEAEGISVQISMEAVDFTVLSPGAIYDCLLISTHQDDQKAYVLPWTLVYEDAVR